jgi:hypothetical protein
MGKDYFVLIHAFWLLFCSINTISHFISIVNTLKFNFIQFTGRRCQDEDKLLKVLIDFDRNGDLMIQPQVHSVFKLFPWIRHFPGFYGNLFRSVIQGRNHLNDLVQDMKVKNNACVLQ